MNAATSIQKSEHADSVRHAAPRANRIDGATPFGGVMSAVRWTPSEGSSSHPQLAADEMFEPRLDAATRRKNALRGNEKLDALRAQSRTRQQSKTPATTDESPTATAEPAVPIANELAVSRLPNYAPEEIAPTPRPPIQSTRGNLLRPDTAHASSNSATKLTNAAQAPYDEAGETPAISPQASATGNASIVPADANANTLARQIAKELGAPRVPESAPSKQAAQVAAIRTDGIQKEVQTGRNKSTSKSDSAATPQSPPDAAPDESAPTRFDDLIRSIRIRAGEKLSSARLQLQPPRLGYMEVDVQMDGDQMRIEVRTETHEARRRVHDQSVHLKTALESAGIDVQHINVSVDPDWLHQRSQSTSTWLQAGTREHGGADQRRRQANPDEQRSTTDIRLDFDRIDGPELSSVDALTLFRGARRVDVRV